jgi:hypothetical protein
VKLMTPESPKQGRTIYRADALRQYAQGRQQPILPRFVRPRTFALLWVLAVLLAAGVGLAWVARVPVFASGVAVLVGAQGHEGETIEVVAFLPAESLSRLRAGQPMFVEAGGAGQRLRLRVAAVEPEVLSPDAARARFASTPTGALVGPSAVAVARFEGARATLPASAYAGSVARVEVEVGSRQVITLLPLVGRAFVE